MNQKEKNKSFSMPHDRGYKRSLSHPKEFLHFIKKYIGAEWMMELQEDQLTLCDKEFVDKDYDGKEADLIYRISGLQQGDAYIFVLQEMQSTVDYTMIFRILVYVVNTLLRVFLSTGRKERERKDFRRTYT